MKFVQAFFCNMDSFLEAISVCGKATTFIVSKDLALTISMGKTKASEIKDALYVIVYCEKERGEKILYIFNTLSNKCFKYVPPENFRQIDFHSAFPLTKKGIKKVVDALR